VTDKALSIESPPDDTSGYDSDEIDDMKGQAKDNAESINQDLIESISEEN
jgi:hypothetical protein